MTIEQQLVEMLKRHEGTGPMRSGNFMPYKDSEGYLTIGYGINIEHTGLRPHEADYLLASRLAEAKRELHSTLPWTKDIDHTRQSALIDMVYNLGIVRFLGFKKAIAHMERKMWNEAAHEMLDSKWAGQVGYRAAELAEMIRTGDWQ